MASSLSSVDPPDVSFILSLPSKVVTEGKLSSLQLESVVYACQRHETILAGGKRAGFLVGKRLCDLCMFSSQNETWYHSLL